MGAFDTGYGDALIDAAQSPVHRPPAGFLESFSLSFEATRQEDLSISERRNLLRKYEERRRAIIELTGEDVEALRLEARRLRSRPSALISGKQELAEKAYRDRISELAARYPEVRTDEEIELDIIEESRRLREREAEVLAHATGMGGVGSFTGAMAATMTDPLVLGSMLFGASASAGILKTALTEATIGAVSEAAIQPFVFRYKQKLGSPFGLGEAAANVGAAAAGGAVLGGAVRAAARGVERLARPRVRGVDDLLEEFDRVVKEVTQEQADARNVLQDLADIPRETPFDPADPIADRVHIEAASKALADAEAGNAVDVQPIVRGQEPQPELRGDVPPQVPEDAPRLELDEDFARWAEAKEAEYLEELEQFDVEGIEIPVGEGIEEGEAFAVLRPAREVIDDAEADIRAGESIVKCLLRG